MESIVRIGAYYCSECGYCDGEDSSFRYGFYSKILSVDVYKDMIDRGFRRSGSFIYKPDLARSCCPLYTIRLDTRQLEISKEHKRVLRQFNRAIIYGDQHINDADSSSVTAILNGNLDWKQAALIADYPNALKLIESQGHQHPAHKFVIKFDNTMASEEKFELYKLYQHQIHHDALHEITMKQFRRFLCSPPFPENKEEPGEIEPSFENSQQKPPRYGGKHLLYYLDDKLIAIDVIDILPGAVSSVYFIWHPDYSHLQLGKYSALREAQLAASWNLNYLYMGYFIYDNPKMSYKASLKPSSLLDPITYQYLPYDSKFKPLFSKGQHFISFVSDKKLKDKYLAISQDPNKAKDAPTRASDADMPGCLTDSQVDKDVNVQNKVDFVCTRCGRLCRQFATSGSSELTCSEILAPNHEIIPAVKELAAVCGKELMSKVAIEIPGLLCDECFTQRHSPLDNAITGAGSRDTSASNATRTRLTVEMLAEILGISTDAVRNQLQLPADFEGELILQDQE